MLDPLILFTLPLAFALIVLGLSVLHLKPLKVVAFLLSLFPLGLILWGNTEWIGRDYKVLWFSPLSLYFYLKIDSISLLFFFLTSLVIPISILTVETKEKQKGLFFFLIFLLEAFLFGLFSARDVALFALFWEASLIPLYFILILWGKEEKMRAALKFILYMIAGSTLMIAAIFFLYFSGSAAPTFDLDILAKTASASPYAKWICAIFLLAFAVKTPLFPFHAWLTDAYTQSPPAGTILLAALLSKAGIYGLLRINLSLFPDLMQQWSFGLVILAIIGVLYGAFAAWGQTDYKRLIAYSSFSHVNFILVAVFLGTALAQQGALLQAFNHGITITGLFLVASWLEKRIQTTSMLQTSGLSKQMPKLCWLTFIFVLASIALPSTNNFVGEIIIFYALFKAHPWQTAFLSLSVVFSVIYMLKWMQDVYFGKPNPSLTSPDIQFKHLLQAAPLVFCIFWIGIYPAFLLKEIKPPTPARANQLELAP